jgi:hypothetical protein
LLEKRGSSLSEANRWQVKIASRFSWRIVRSLTRLDAAGPFEIAEFLRGYGHKLMWLYRVGRTRAVRKREEPSCTGTGRGCQSERRESQALSKQDAERRVGYWRGVGLSNEMIVFRIIDAKAKKHKFAAK